jgi:hypothetical protein
MGGGLNRKAAIGFHEAEFVTVGTSSLTYERNFPMLFAYVK